MSKYILSQSAQTMVETGSSPAKYNQSSTSKPNNSKIAYYNAKNKYGSSSAWYDSAVQEQKNKKSFVDTLEQQIAAKLKSGRDRYHLTDKQTAEGKTVNRPWMSENWSRDDGKSLEDLQKELEKAQAELKRADEDLAYAAEWRYYDADMEWMDNVKNSGQDWGVVSDNLGMMADNLSATYNEQLKAYTDAMKQNERIELARRQGGVPTEVGYSYTGEEELAKMYAELTKTGELRDMANRRYGYSLDELSKDSKAVERGKLMNEHLLTMDAQTAEQNMEEYVQGHVKGDTLGALRESYRNDKSDYRPSDLWNETQLNRYYVLLDRQGEEAAGKYAVEVNSYNNLAAKQEAVQGVYDWGYAEGANGWDKTARGLAGTGATVLAMPGELGEFIYKMERVDATGAYIDSAKPKLHDYAEAMTEGRADSLNELGTVAGKGLGDVYKLTNSMAQSLVYGNTVGTAGTLALFFGSAANQGFDDAMSRGATPEQAVSFGMLSGIAEAAAELVPLENLLNADKAMARGLLKSAMIQAGLEGLEEGETDVLNAIADRLVMGDKSAITSAINERIAQGESYADAARAEWGNFVKDTVWDMIGGAISGGGSSVIQYGATMMSPYEDVDGFSVYGASAQQLGREAAALTGKENKRLAALGKKVEASAAKGNKISNYTAKKLAQGTNRVAMLEAVKKQISERQDKLKGEDAGMLANAIVSEARGEKPGPKGKRLMEENKELSESLLSELDIRKPAAWAQQIGLRGIEGVFYGDREEVAAQQKLREDAKELKANTGDMMNAEVSIPTAKGEVKGTLTGFDMNGKNPRYIIKGEDGKLNYVSIDEAHSSGEIPEGVELLTHEVLGMGEVAGEVYKLYSPGQNVTEYVTDMRAAIKLASNVSKRSVFNKSEAARNLTEEQRSFAWHEGVRRRDKRQAGQRDTESRRKQNKPVKRGMVRSEAVNMNGVKYKAGSKDKISAAELRVIERIARAANVNVVLYESETDSKGDYIGANGFYHNGTVYLDVHAGANKSTEKDAILLTAAHELTHHIRESAEAQYDELKEFVIEHLIENGHDFETMVQDRLRREKDTSYDDAVEEVIADACEMVLRNSRAVEKLAKENRTLAQTIADWLHGFYEDIKEAFAGVEARSKEAKAMEDYMDELVKLWDDALIKASRSEGKQSGKAKQQARDVRGNVVVDENVTLQSVKKTLEEIFTGKHKKQSFTFPVLKHTPQVFMDYCYMDGDRSFVMQSYKAYKAMKGNAKHQHNLGVNGLIQVIKGLYYPEYIVLQNEGANAGHYVAVVAIDNGETVAAVDLGSYRPKEAAVNGEEGFYNVLVTAFPNENDYIDKVILSENNDILYSKDTGKKYEIPESVAGADSTTGRSTDISENSIRESDTEVKYSRRDSSEGLSKEEARAQALAYTRLRAENAALERRLEYWIGQSRQSKQRSINRKDVEKYARQLVKMHSSTADPKWIKQQISALGDYLVQNEKPDMEHARILAWKTATDIAAKAELEYESGWDMETKQEILSSIREARMHLDPEYKNDLPEGFRKQYSGKLHISFKDGRGVDSVYQELQAEYGTELFPEMQSPADMLVMMAEAYDTLNAPPAVYNPYGSNMNETINSITNDILDMLLSGSIRETAPTVRDRMEKKLSEEQDKRHEAVKKEKAAKWEKYDKAVQEGREAVKQLRADKNARIEEIKQLETSKRKEMRAKEKAAKWKKVEGVTNYYRDMIKRERAERNESAASQRYRTSIYRSINSLSNMLLKNSDKEHVPEALKEPVLEMLTSLDVSSRRLLKKGESTKRDEKYAEKMQALRDVLAQQRAYMKAPGEAEGLDVFLDLPEGFDEVLKQHIASVKSIYKKHEMAQELGPIVFMNSTQLQELDHILTVLRSSIGQINTYLTESRYKSVKEGARASREFLREMGTEIERNLAKDKADKFLAWSNALPIYVFKRFGDAGSERFMALVKGWDQMAKNVEQVLKYVEAENTGYTSEEVREWEETVHEIELSGERTVKMTTAQIMGLYCSNRREQARRHLLAGGMRVGDIETKKGKKIAQTDAFRLTMDDIIKITSELEPRQIEVANSLQDYMNTVCADWGNEISMARFGYRQFTEENYYPITTDPNNHPAVDPKAKENDIFRLLNMAFTKQLNPMANNSIVIFSIFDVFSSHAADMAKYNALALPILDMMKWYNHKDTVHHDVKDSQGNINRQLRAESVQASAERAYGKQAQSYMINFLKDLNGTREGGRNEELLKGLTGKYKAAAVGLNLRVAVQQPTSIVRAGYLLSPKYLIAGAAMPGGIEEAKANSGLAVWKSLGYFDTNLSRGMRQQIKHDDSMMDKLRDKGMWLAEQGDKITWGAIWNACKLEQQDKGLEGDKLIQATTERFNEVILSTQVMDSTISRSDLMRSQSHAVNELTSFMSEPTVSYNILLDSVMQFETVRRRTGSITEARRETWPKMGKALGVFALSTFTTAAAAAIVDAMRDDDEYQKATQKWLEHLESNFKDGINPLRLLPFISDLWEVIVQDETPESMVWQSVTQAKKGASALVDMYRSIFKPGAELSDPNRTSWGRLYYVAQAMSSLTGLPIAGFMREFKTVWNMSGGIGTGKKLKNYDSGVKNEVKYALKDEYISEEKAIALLMESGEYEDVNDAYWQVQEWAHAEDSEWTRYSEVDAAILAGDKKAFEAARDKLGEHGIEPKSVRSHAKSHIGDLFVGSEGVPAKINAEMAVKYLQEFAGLTKIEAQHQVDKWKFEKDTGVAWADLKDAFVTGKFTEEQTKKYLMGYGHEYSKDAAEKVREWKCEKETGIALSYLSEAYIHGEISETQAVKYLEKYGGESKADAEAKAAQWGLAIDYGIKYSSTDAGIKKNLIEGYISTETAKAIMIAMGKTAEEAEDYVNQYLFTAETGYGFSEIEEAYADGVISYDEMVEWYKIASIYTHGSEETAIEYAEVARWKRDIPGAESMNRTGLEKWNEKGDYMQRAGLNEEDFADAWTLYNQSYAKYNAKGEKTAEKAEVFFDTLHELYRQGIYSKAEIDAIARTIYAKSSVNKYAPW